MAHSPELIKELEEKVNVVRHNILRIFEGSGRDIAAEHCLLLKL